MVSYTGISTEAIVSCNTLALAFRTERLRLDRSQGTEWTLTAGTAWQDAEIDTGANIRGAFLVQPPCSLVLELLLLSLRKERLKKLSDNYAIIARFVIPCAHHQSSIAIWQRLTRSA
jgi:hypothetical protein